MKEFVSLVAPPATELVVVQGLNATAQLTIVSIPLVLLHAPRGHSARLAPAWKPALM